MIGEKSSLNKNCLEDGNWSRTVWTTSNKIRNKNIRTINGNSRKALDIMHWNLGSTYWIRKTHHIQQLVDEKCPDLLYISEANLFLEDIGELDYKIKIDGYNLHLPKSMVDMQYSRIILLARENLEIQEMQELMDPSVASIWVKIGGRGRRNMFVGGIYREQTLLNQQDPNNSADPLEQDKRWKTFINQWLRANTMGPCLVIGDCNLDKIKWDLPEFNHVNMVNMIKDNIETLNYNQIVQEPTRFWPNQAPSTIDHIWTSQPQKVVSSINQTRAVGDHNLIGVKIRIKGQTNSNQNIVKRDRSSFDIKMYRDRIKTINWSQMYKMDDLNLAYNFFEEQILSILDNMAPIKTIQPRKNPNNWVSTKTKELIKNRDQWREVARLSNQQEAWSKYRNLRNQCNGMIRKGQTGTSNQPT